MAKLSAGLMMFRRREGALEVFLVHPGGPLFRSKDDGVWSVAKGLVHPGEDLEATARREFEEETGLKPVGELLPLGTVVLKSGKVVHAWAFEGDWHPLDGLRSNLFDMEWPPHSGRHRSFPEVDRAAFFSLDEARRKIHPAQREFVDRLEDFLAKESDAAPMESGALPEWLCPLGHTADAGFFLQAGSLAELFERAAWGMFSLITDLRKVEPRQSQTIRVEADDRSALLVSWLSELNYRHATEHLLFSRFAVRKISGTAMEAEAFGEPIDPARHVVDTEIKAVTFHDLRIENEGRNWTAQILFDV